MKPVPGRCNVILTGKAHRDRAKLGKRRYCRRYPTPGGAHCRIHSGQTGPVTEQGLANTVAGMKTGRARWVADMHAKIARGEVDRFPCGRKAGGRNRTPGEREQAAYEKQCERQYRRIALRTRADHRARRDKKRQERAELVALERCHDSLGRGVPKFSFADLAGHLETMLDGVIAAASLGPVRGTMRDDFCRLERTFIESLTAFDLPADRVEALYRRFVRIEDFLDRGMDADRRRRGRLEEAYDRWRAVERSNAIVAAGRATGLRMRGELRGG